MKEDYVGSMKEKDEICKKPVQQMCKYCCSGICILSDTKCLKMADSSIVCSSYTVKND
jgi:hypothetical protein